jgi:cytochrome c
MAMGRHLYREESLAAHRELMAESTAEFQREVQAAAWRKEQGISLVKAARGEKAFQVCAACHVLDREKAAPSIREIQQIYAGNPAGIVAWSKSPGRKRTQFAPMPPLSHMPEADLQAAAEYMLKLGQTEPAAADADEPDAPKE